jgi:hypothetical protein
VRGAQQVKVGLKPRDVGEPHPPHRGKVKSWRDCG